MIGYCNKLNPNAVMNADTAVQLINDYLKETVEDEHGRYLSWRHCYKIFGEKRNLKDKATIDYLSLHLAFYLASWGMYRGSSFLLQKDYKIHIPVVKIIQEEKYNPLFNISAKNLLEDKNLLLIEDISKRIKRTYAAERPVKGSGTNNATETLISKILLGTLGCVPAYDRYFIDGVKRYKVSSGQYNSNSIRNIAQYYCDNESTFENLRAEISNNGIEYPAMKLMDMCFWQATFAEND